VALAISNMRGSSVIIGYTPDGVPIVDPVAIISQSGQFYLDAVLQARCALLTDP
jgi:hypothetical protein